jgi:hypothetical protein
LQNRIIARLEKLEEFQAAHPVVDPEKSPASVDLIVFAPNLKGR